MAKAIYLFKAHENYEAGKSSLQRAAVFKTNLIAILCLIIFLLGLLAWSLYIPSQLLNNDPSFGITRGSRISCEDVREDGRVITYASYEYTVDGQSYGGRSQWRSLYNCLNNEEFTIYFRVENPELSSLRQPYSENDLGISLLFCFFLMTALFGLLFSMKWVIENLIEQHRYHRLQRADTIFEATVIKTRTTKAQKFADYYFFNHDKEKLHGRIQARWNYKWPKDIEQGDILYVLYLDEKTYCVL